MSLQLFTGRDVISCYWSCKTDNAAKSPYKFIAGSDKIQKGRGPRIIVRMFGRQVGLLPDLEIWQIPIKKEKGTYGIQNYWRFFLFFILLDIIFCMLIYRNKVVFVVLWGMASNGEGLRVPAEVSISAFKRSRIDLLAERFVEVTKRRSLKHKLWPVSFLRARRRNLYKSC